VPREPVKFAATELAQDGLAALPDIFDGAFRIAQEGAALCYLQACSQRGKGKRADGEEVVVEKKNFRLGEIGEFGWASDERNRGENNPARRDEAMRWG